MTRSASTWRVALVSAAIGLAVWAWPSPAVRAAAPVLTDSVEGLGSPIETQADATVLRSRYITIDFSGLPREGERPAARDTAVTLRLFPDTDLAARFERLDASPTGTTWVGQVENVPMSRVTLAYRDGLLTGSISLGGVWYVIRPAAEDVRLANPQPGRELHVVAEVDQSRFPPEAPPIEVTLPADDIARAAREPLADSADTIDVMVLYTSLAASWAGGAAAMTNLINVGVSETNTAYANSGIAQRIRLVHAAPVSYVEVGAFSTNLSNLRLGVGDLSGVLALRNQFKADYVKLLVHPTGPDACGIAYVMNSVSTAFEAFGYSVTDSACVTPSYTFAHELGHNMGAHHDWYVSSSLLPYPFAHGFADTVQRVRTIMSYNDACTASGFSCARLLSFSNPDIRFVPFCSGRGVNCDLLRYWFFPGSPVGVPSGTNSTCRTGVQPTTPCDADNRRALNTTAPVAANLRQQ